jgi:pilus assembly protein CpaE
MRDGAWEKESPQSGQASVELLAGLPAALLLALIAWQLLLAGEATWLAGNAARVAARAHAVGADPGAAARSALPSHLRRGLTVESSGDRVHVRLRLPLVLAGWRSPLGVSAAAALPRQSPEGP